MQINVSIRLFLVCEMSDNSLKSKVTFSNVLFFPNKNSKIREKQQIVAFNETNRGEEREKQIVAPVGEKRGRQKRKCTETL